jgi:hypothetical protein
VVTAPYMCGETADNNEDRPRFRAIADGWVDYNHSNYYMNKVFVATDCNKFHNSRQQN